LLEDRYFFCLLVFFSLPLSALLPESLPEPEPALEPLLPLFVAAAAGALSPPVLSLLAGALAEPFAPDVPDEAGVVFLRA
jgi:hypothetical protein